MSDHLTLALDHLAAAESCVAYEAHERPHRFRIEQRLIFVAKRARGIAERAEQAARNCAARRENIVAAEASLSLMLNEAAE
jgi:anti-sigma-K factor RskA